MNNTYDKNRADQLQFLRFLAFCNIFLLHGSGYNIINYPVGNAAALSVSFFVILGGVVTGYSGYNKEIILSVKEITGYMGKKIKKIYPLYILTTIVTILYSGLPMAVALYDYSAVFSRLIQLGKNLFLIQSWFPSGYFSYNGPGWYLSTVIFLYLFNLPVLKLLQKIEKLKTKWIIYIGSFIILLFITVWYCYQMQTSNMEFWEYVFPPSRLGEYLCGMILGYGIRSIIKEIPCSKIAAILFTVLEFATIFGWFYSMFCPVAAWKYRIVAWLLPNMTIIAVFSFGKGLLSVFFRTKLLKWLGDISFECYLLHQIILTIYVKLSGVGQQSVLGCLFSLFLCMVTTVIFAMCFNKVSAQCTK